MARSADFRRRKVNLVCHFIKTCSALRARPLSSHRNVGDDLAQIGHFQGEKTALEGYNIFQPTTW